MQQTNAWADVDPAVSCRMVSLGQNELNRVPIPIQNLAASIYHDDVIKWRHFPRYWPFARGIHRSPVNSPHKGQWRGALMFSLICAWINDWANNREAGDFLRHRTHYDVIVMLRDLLIEHDLGYVMVASWHGRFFPFYRCILSSKSQWYRVALMNGLLLTWISFWSKHDDRFFTCYVIDDVMSVWPITYKTTHPHMYIC